MRGNLTRYAAAQVVVIEEVDNNHRNVCEMMLNGINQRSKKEERPG